MALNHELKYCLFSQIFSQLTQQRIQHQMRFTQTTCHPQDLRPAVPPPAYHDAVDRTTYPPPSTTTVATTAATNRFTRMSRLLDHCSRRK